MELITLEEAKTYLRVDFDEEDGIIESLLVAAINLCTDVARVTEEQLEEESVREVMKVAVFYCLGYMYEHRDSANYRDLTLTLRSILFAIREGVV